MLISATLGVKGLISVNISDENHRISQAKKKYCLVSQTVYRALILPCNEYVFWGGHFEFFFLNKQLAV